MQALDVNELPIDAVGLWARQWLLLTAGSIDDCNMMTVAWGGIGCMWGRPAAHIVVRPQRHTFGYIEAHDNFTLCAFPDDYHDDLQTLGTISGRDGDKLARTRLTLMPSTQVSSPSYEQASFILECRKLYFQDFDPTGFIDPALHEVYPARDYHRLYFGQILAAFKATD